MEDDVCTTLVMLCVVSVGAEMMIPDGRILVALSTVNVFTQYMYNVV